MCTAFISRGTDLIFGFNMDINEGAFPYDVYATDEWFGVGTPADPSAFSDASGQQTALPSFYRISNGVRRIHGVSRRGAFAACLNNMNVQKAPFRLAEDACSLDQLTDDVISGRRSLEEVRRFARQVEIVTLPGGAVDVPDPGFHALMGDAEGNILLVEPGSGCAAVREKFAVMTNFPLLEPPQDLTEAAGYYGKDRYDTASAMLRAAGDGLTPEDALSVLRATRQTGNWATRVSFVYSCSRNTVYYCLQGDFEDIRIHRFA